MTSLRQNDVRMPPVLEPGLWYYGFVEATVKRKPICVVYHATVGRRDPPEDDVKTVDGRPLEPSSVWVMEGGHSAYVWTKDEVWKHYEDLWNPNSARNLYHTGLRLRPSGHWCSAESKAGWVKRNHREWVVLVPELDAHM